MQFLYSKKKNRTLKRKSNENRIQQFLYSRKENRMSSHHCALVLPGSLWKEISLDPLNLYQNEISSCSQKRRLQRGAVFFESGKRFYPDKEERECILEKTISPCLQMMRVTAKRLRDQARCRNGFHSRCVESDTFSIRYSLTWYGVAMTSRLHKIIGLFGLLPKEPYKRDDILQKRGIILRSLLIVATP